MNPNLTWGLALLESPAELPLSLAETKVVLRVDDDIVQDDVYISALIGAATAAAETKTGRQLMTARYELTLSAWPARRFQLPRPPFLGDAVMAYLDPDGVEQVVSASLYAVHEDRDPAIVELLPEFGFPALASRLDAVRVRYDAGYPSAADVPDGVRTWMLVKVATWYEQRQTVRVGQAMDLGDGFLDGLLDPSTVRTFP